MEKENYLFKAYSGSIYIDSNANFQELCNPLTTGVIHNLEFRAAVMNVAMMTLLTLSETDRNNFIQCLNELVADEKMVSNVINEFRQGPGVDFDLCPVEGMQDTPSEAQMPASIVIKPSKIKS